MKLKMILTVLIGSNTVSDFTLRFGIHWKPPEIADFQLALSMFNRKQYNNAAKTKTVKPH